MTPFPPLTAKGRPDPFADGTIRQIQDHLGAELRAVYGDPAATRMPECLSRLTDHLGKVIRRRDSSANQPFINELLGSSKSLRAYALSLTKNVDHAEDLVQETVLKALSYQHRFAPGTNLGAWLFTILRNSFHSKFRKTQREVEDPENLHAQALITIPDQLANLERQDFEAALAKLPKEQSEALLLVGADGVSYKEASQILGIKVGTVKSRISRARNHLAAILEIEHDDEIGGSRIPHLDRKPTPGERAKLSVDAQRAGTHC